MFGTSPPPPPPPPRLWGGSSLRICWAAHGGFAIGRASEPPGPPRRPRRGLCTCGHEQRTDRGRGRRSRRAGPREPLQLAFPHSRCGHFDAAECNTRCASHGIASSADTRDWECVATLHRLNSPLHKYMPRYFHIALGAYGPGLGVKQHLLSRLIDLTASVLYVFACLRLPRVYV